MLTSGTTAPNSLAFKSMGNSTHRNKVGGPVRAVSMSRNMENPMTSTSNLEQSNEYYQLLQPAANNSKKQSRVLLPQPHHHHQSKLSDIRKRNMSVVSPSGLPTD